MIEFFVGVCVYHLQLHESAASTVEQFAHTDSLLIRPSPRNLMAWRTRRVPLLSTSTTPEQPAVK